MNWSIEDGILKLKEKLLVAEKNAFISALVVGFITHSFIFYNKISYADDSRFYFGLGTTYPSGRWALGLIGALKEWIGLQNYSSSLINGMVSLLLLASFSLLIVRVLKIEKSVDGALIGAYIVTFPVVTSTFAYMFTAPYYFWAALLMALAACVVEKTWWRIISSAFIVCFGMGIYQAYFCVATALFVLKLIIRAKDNAFVKNVQTAVCYLMSLVLGLCAYFGFNKFFLYITETKLGGYQGIDTMTNISLDDILTGVHKAYSGVFQLKEADFVGISHAELIQNMYNICLVLTLVVAAGYVILLYKRHGIWNALYGAVLFIMMPLAIGLIFVMTLSPNTYIHTLMVYSFVLIPIIPLVVTNQLEEKCGKTRIKSVLTWIRNIIIIVVMSMCLFYFRLDNVAYMKADHQQENAKVYYTVLLSEIKGLDEYSDKYPVVFLGNMDGMDESIILLNEFNEIQLQGYNKNMNEFLAYSTSTWFFERHSGYYFEFPENMEEIYASEYIR